MYNSVEDLISKAPELKGYQPVKNSAKRLSLNLTASKDNISKSQSVDFQSSDNQGVVDPLNLDSEIIQVSQEANKILEEIISSSVQKITRLKDSIKLIIIQLDAKIQEYDKVLVAKRFAF